MIAPAKQATFVLADQTCQGLRNQYLADSAYLKNLSEKQSDAVAQDLLSVLIIGIPTSGGGYNKKISLKKREIIEIGAIAERKKCHWHESISTNDLDSGSLDQESAT